MTTDFTITDGGTVSLLTPLTTEGQDWLEGNLVGDVQTLGSAVAVGSRYVLDLCLGILGDGLTIEKDGLAMFAGDDGDLYLARPEGAAA